MVCPIVLHGAESNDIPVEVSADGSNVMSQVRPGAFMFIAQDELPKLLNFVEVAERQALVQHTDSETNFDSRRSDEIHADDNFRDVLNEKHYCSYRHFFPECLPELFTRNALGRNDY